MSLQQKSFFGNAVLEQLGKLLILVERSALKMERTCKCIERKFPIFSIYIKLSPSLPVQNDKSYAYKKSSYQYSSSGDNNLSYQSKSPDQNIDQLDALLEDLKQERQNTTRERDSLPTGTSYRTL